MKRTVHIAGKMETFFAPDENVRCWRLRCACTHLHDSKLTIEGEQHAVAQAVRIVEESNHARKRQGTYE